MPFNVALFTQDLMDSGQLEALAKVNLRVWDAGKLGTRGRVEFVVYVRVRVTIRWTFIFRGFIWIPMFCAC